MTNEKLRFLAVLTTFVALSAGTVAHADDKFFTASNPTWKAECGSCHIAYPPALLPAASWRTMMSDLEHHFGVDASIDASAAKEIGAFLEANAGRARRETNASVTRISETGWFVHEHDEVPARVWKSPVVKSAANCEACHTRAADGDFSKRTRRVPN